MNNNGVEIKNLRILETKINNRLFIICAVVTLVTMAMILMDFFTHGFFSGIKINFFYLGVLLIYSLHKELTRWLGENKVERQGEYFVYFWILLTTVLFVINFLTHEHFTSAPNGGQINTLQDTTLITLEVLAVFISTRFLKLLKISLKDKN